MKNLVFSISFILLGFSLCAQDWQGTWSSNFGELRMVQKGNTIYADYSNVGTLKGRVSGRSFRGTFNNKNSKRKGRFSFLLSRDKKSFSGKWSWNDGSSSTNKWTGKLISNRIPTLTSPEYKRYNKTNKGTGKECQGTWSSNIGELRMVQVKNKVYIDYSNKGYMSGTYNPATRTLEGTFENTKTGRNGKFKFVFTRGHRAFSGKWGRHNQPLSRNWSGKRKSGKRPTLTTPQFQRYNPGGGSGSQTQNQGNSNKKVKYEIEVNIRHLVVVEENDGPGDNLELYGHVYVDVYKNSKKRIANKYKRNHVVWKQSEHRARSKSVGEKITINRKLHYDIDAKDVDSAFIRVGALLQEEDEVSRNDLITQESFEVLVRDIINPRSRVHAAGKKGYLLSGNEGAARLVYEFKVRKL